MCKILTYSPVRLQGKHSSSPQTHTSITNTVNSLRILIHAWKVMKRLENFLHLLTGRFFDFFSMYCNQHCFICLPSDSSVSEDAGFDPRTVATSALAVRRSNNSARSHPIILLQFLPQFWNQNIFFWHIMTSQPSKPNRQRTAQKKKKICLLKTCLRIWCWNYSGLDRQVPYWIVNLL